jgi:seryl-tRNA synthetase
VLDIKWIRDNPEAFVEGMTNRGFDDPSGTLLRIVGLDEERRATIGHVQAWQEQRNRISKEIGVAKKAGDEARVSELMDQMSRLKSDITHAGEEVAKRREEELNELLAKVPNIPAPDVPIGPDAESNVVIREVGTPKNFSFQPKQHFELGEALGLMDFETAAKLSGARFVVLKGALARLERALSQFMLDLHTSEHGYTEINPPLLVRNETMFGTAQLPKFGDDQFPMKIVKQRIEPEYFVQPLEQFLLQSTALESFKEKYASNFRSSFLRRVLDQPIDVKVRDAMRLMRNAIAHSNTSTEVLFSDYVKRIFSDENVDVTWLIPTAEVPLTNLVREDIVDEAKLPMRVTAGTPCFRAEAGAAGKDTRGMIRQHQFSKVELVSVTTPEQSAEEHERMTTCAETVLKRLELPYRTVVLSTGDMGFAAEKTYDIEVWLPGQGMYREISSCSNCGDFQARRMNARYRPKGEKSPRFVHTLNGSGVAVGRALIAVMENYQDADGSIRVPDALKPYMGGLAKIEAPT